MRNTKELEFLSDCLTGAGYSGSTGLTRGRESIVFKEAYKDSIKDLAENNVIWFDSIEKNDQFKISALFNRANNYGSEYLTENDIFYVNSKTFPTYSDGDVESGDEIADIFMEYEYDTEKAKNKLYNLLGEYLVSYHKDRIQNDLDIENSKADPDSIDDELIEPLRASLTFGGNAHDRF